MSIEPDEDRLWSRPFLLVVLAVIAGGIELGVAQGAVSTMLDALGRKDVAQGLLFTLHSAGSISGSLLAALIIRRLGDTRVVFLGVAFAGLAWTLHASIGRYAPALPLFVLAGVGHGWSIAGGSAFALRSSGGLGARRLSVLHAMFVLGMSLGSLLGGCAAGWHQAGASPWRIAFAASAALSFLAALGVALGTRPDTGRARDETIRLGVFRDIALIPGALIAIGMICLGIGVETGMGAWLSRFLQKLWDADPAVGGWAVALFFAGITSGRLLLGWRPPTWARERVVRAAALCAAAPAVALLFAPPVLSLPLAFLTGVAASPIIPFSLAVISHRSPRSLAPAATAAALAVAASGGLVMPGAMGALATFAESRRVAMFTPVVLLILVVLLASLLAAARRNSKDRSA